MFTSSSCTVQLLRICVLPVRRAIAGYEVDSSKFVTKVKFVDKRGTIMDYSKLLGDLSDNKKQEPPLPPTRRVDLSKLSTEEWETVRRGRAILKLLIQEGIGMAE